MPDDRDAFVVRGSKDQPPTTVFLPGLCSNAYGYLWAFPVAARAAGGVLAIDGDRPCGAESSGFRSFSWDVDHLQRRITAALAAAGQTRTEGLTLIGYSQGATLAERLVQRFPGRYPRVVLIGSPSPVAVPRLKGVRAVVTMSCSLDATWRMKTGARRLTQAGVAATYVEMPGCTHGNIGEGDRVFGEVFRWLRRQVMQARGDGSFTP